ncbi:hypothetical protein I3843_09G210400 [Carya illinoinensis]|nr:uncharacterized protein LOC122276394 isoform X2 [Carya illinoinensis]KAG2690964.1 hypothetical protein I3760_09G214900 [Carya illinoinensis]KAG7965168.1 hypothetical protein I3843_09G210400 [Carya illinoinensis]
MGKIPEPERLNTGKESKEKQDNRRAGKMEDGLLGAESLEHSMNLTPKGGSKEVDDRKEEDDKKENEAKGGEERPSGFINHLLSNLVSGGEGQEEKAGEKVDEEKRGIVSEEGVDHEDKGGGFISHLISNLVSSHSPKAGKDREQKVEAFEGDNGGSKAEEDAGSDSNGVGLRKGKSKEKSGGGGIIENLVSHLPAPLQDDVAPPPDEASILIHSIIHD